MKDKEFPVSFYFYKLCGSGICVHPYSPERGRSSVLFVLFDFLTQAEDWRLTPPSFDPNPLQCHEGCYFRNPDKGRRAESGCTGAKEVLVLV